MIKLTFRNDTNLGDMFTLLIPKVYVSNYNKDQSTQSTNYNNVVALYENYQMYYNDVDIPSYDELTSSISKYYICDNIPNLRIKINYSRGSRDNTGQNIIGGDAYIQFGSNYSNTARITLGTTYPYNVLSASQYVSGSYGAMTLGYDPINRVFVSWCRRAFTINGIQGAYENVKMDSTHVYGKSSYLAKGNTFTVGSGDTMPKTFGVDVLGDTFKADLYLALDYPTGNSKSLYDYIESGGLIPEYPDGDDDDDYPDGDGDKDSDPVPPDPDFPISVAQTGFVSMYAPTLSQLRQLASYMWSTDFLDILAKLQQDPYEAIISLKAVKCNFDKGGTSNIILGNVDTKISSTLITNQYQQIDCGYINLNRFYGNFLDFNPYTSIKIYLPFIGYRDLDVDEVMGSTLHLYYNIDLLTGSCVALLHVNKEINGTNLDSVLYQFDGVIANEIPVTASNFTQVLSSIIRGAATTAAAIGVTAATGGAGAPASGALLGSAVAGEASTAIGTTMVVNSAIDTVTSKISVQHGGGLSGSMGSLATKQPYVIIQRVIEKNPSNYAKLHGVPSNAYKTLSTLKGFTKMQDIQITSTIGTVDETEEIKQLLMSGVVF